MGSPRDDLQTSRSGLRHDLLPMKLYHKAKQLGTWNPREIDFSQDRVDWLACSPEERDLLLRLAAMFQGGEEAVTLDLLPLMLTIAREGRLEEEMYLATFLWEEAKHVEFFDRVIHEVCEGSGELERYHTPAYRRLFCEELPSALSALLDDPSPAAQARASITYNMIVEGVIAETGYHAYLSVLARRQLMPGICAGVRLLNMDESRHLAYGVYLLSRLVAADPSLWPGMQARLHEMFALSLEIINEVFDSYTVVPFDLAMDDFTQYAASQFMARERKIAAAVGVSPERLADLTSDDAETSEPGEDSD